MESTRTELPPTAIPTLAHTQSSLALAVEPPRTVALSGSNARNSRLYVEPLIPTALASALSTTSDGTATAHDTLMADDLPLVSALSMADEVVRAALLERPNSQHGATRGYSSTQGGNPLVG